MFAQGGDGEAYRHSYTAETDIWAQALAYAGCAPEGAEGSAARDVSLREYKEGFVSKEGG